jgi:hypothetical protein
MHGAAREEVMPRFILIHRYIGLTAALLLAACGGGGSGSGSPAQAGAELFASESEGFTATGALNTPRDGHTATALVDGTILVTGGTDHRGRQSVVVLSSAELFK